MKIKHPFGITLTEIVVVLIIIGILAGISVSRLRMAAFHERTARSNLRLAWQSEMDFFSFYERYSNTWVSLGCGDLNLIDSFFTYTFEVATDVELEIKATSVADGSRWFIIDENSVITDDAGVTY